MLEDVPARMLEALAPDLFEVWPKIWEECLCQLELPADDAARIELCYALTSLARADDPDPLSVSQAEKKAASNAYRLLRRLRHCIQGEGISSLERSIETLAQLQLSPEDADKLLRVSLERQQVLDLWAHERDMTKITGIIQLVASQCDPHAWAKSEPIQRPGVLEHFVSEVQRLELVMDLLAHRQATRPGHRPPKIGRAKFLHFLWLLWTRAQQSQDVARHQIVPGEFIDFVLSINRKLPSGFKLGTAQQLRDALRTLRKQWGEHTPSWI